MKPPKIHIFNQHTVYPSIARYTRILCGRRISKGACFCPAQDRPQEAYCLICLHAYERWLATGR